MWAVSMWAGAGYVDLSVHLYVGMWASLCTYLCVCVCGRWLYMFDVRYCNYHFCLFSCFVVPWLKPDGMVSDTAKTYTCWDKRWQVVLDLVAAKGDEILLEKFKDLCATVPILVNSAKFTVSQAHQDNVSLRAELDACKKDKDEIAKEQQKVARRDARLGEQADKIDELQNLVAAQAQEIEKLNQTRSQEKCKVFHCKKPYKGQKESQENCNMYRCKNAYKGCLRMTDNTHNRKMHEIFCNFNEVDKDGNPRPLNANQKKKEQKKRAAERRTQAAAPYERPAAPASQW